MVPDTHAIAAALLDDVDDVVLDPQVSGCGHVRPLFDELSLVREQLHPVVLAVGDIDAAVPVHPDIMQQRELTRPRALLSPRLQKLAGGGELVDAVASVAVRDEQATVRGDSPARMAY